MNILDFSECSILKPKVDENTKRLVGNELYHALSTVGFTYLQNTGIPSELLAKVFERSKQFFDSKPEVKQQFSDVKNFKGYVPLYTEGTNVKRSKDIKEAYNFNMINDENKHKLCPMNDVPEFYDSMKQFSEITKKLAVRILEVLSEGMKIKDKSYLIRCHSRMSGKNNFTTLRSLYYPPILNDSTVKPNQIRLGEHTDFGSFTLLFQDQMGGLEVKNQEGKFIEAKPISGTVIVNIGDILQLWSSRRLKSTEHRIMIPSDESKRRTHRQSIVYFVHPDFETKLRPIEYESESASADRPKFVDDENIVTAHEYVTNLLESRWD
uniref:2-oxoglutarate-dependent dioxygenase htyE-like n=1 Tax=Styela clava TaxID=7725 RepID=UPI00193928A7|nr:2-oxoglutarate-dependent dioxygenase htyE-like [Styela clava]